MCRSTHYSGEPEFVCPAAERPSIVPNITVESLDCVMATLSDEKSNFGQTICGEIRMVIPRKLLRHRLFPLRAGQQWAYLEICQANFHL